MFRKLKRWPKLRVLIVAVCTVALSFGASCAGLYVYSHSVKPSPTSSTVKPTPTSTGVQAKVAAKKVATTATTKKTTAHKAAVKVVAKVVAPSPHSSVSKLKPTTTTAPPSGSGSTTSSPTSPPIRTSTIGYSSTNWSGYLAAGGSFTTVSGSWTIPSVSGSGQAESADGAWIGIGGVTTSDLIQVGTGDYVDPSGTVSEGVFYELLPAGPQMIATISVHPGDAINASITESSANHWTISISDATNGGTYTSNVVYSSTNSSAEWIEEAPSYPNGTLVALNNFGSISFSGCSSTVDGYLYGLSTIGASSIKMVSSAGQSMAVPSPISGSGFSVARQ